MNHEDYLKQTIRSKKIELENLNINHRIMIAEYNAKKEMIYEQIDSIERQLNNQKVAE